MGTTRSQRSSHNPWAKSAAVSAITESNAARYALVVDDDVDFCVIMREMLKWRGFETRIAHNAADAWSLLARTRPHVMLIDIMMPEVDGLELVRKLRSDEKFADIRIIMITARAIKDMLEASQEAGADFFLTKPISLFELTRTIDKVM